MSATACTHSRTSVRNSMITLQRPTSMNKHVPPFQARKGLRHYDGIARCPMKRRLEVSVYAIEAVPRVTCNILGKPG
eukprot:scaffold167025_cov19-Tisochrysis_lutea.AAC.2